MNAYESACREALAKIGRGDVPFQVLEASMRLQYGTLGHLDRATFRGEAQIAAGMWDEDREGCLRLADSYGMTTSTEGADDMSKKSSVQPTPETIGDPTTEATNLFDEAAQTRTEAATDAKASTPKRRHQPTRDAAEPAQTSPADATQPGLAPANTSEEELVVFAFRLTRTERDLIHAAAGSARASRFVRGLAIAGARGDLKTIETLVAETQAK